MPKMCSQSPLLINSLFSRFSFLIFPEEIHNFSDIYLLSTIYCVAFLYSAALQKTPPLAQEIKGVLHHLVLSVPQCCYGSISQRMQEARGDRCTFCMCNVWCHCDPRSLRGRRSGFIARESLVSSALAPLFKYIHPFFPRKSIERAHSSAEGHYCNEGCLKTALSLF